MASGPSGNHLFVIPFDPKIIDGYGSNECILLVPICSVYPGDKHDSSCIVHTGEHDFATHESFMDYRHSRIESVSHVRGMITSGVFKEYNPVAAPLLLKIQQGFSLSKRIKRHVKEDFQL